MGGTSHQHWALGSGNIKIISKGIVMWIKASDICTETFLHIAAPKLRSTRIQKPNSVNEKNKKSYVSCLAFDSGKIKIISAKGIVMWVNASDISTGAFLHISAPNLHRFSSFVFQSQKLWKATSNGVTLFRQPYLFCNHKHHFHRHVLYSTSMLTEIELDRIRKFRV